VRRVFSSLLCALFVAAPAAAQEPLGSWGLWAAFRGADRCYAVAEPVATSAPGTRPYATVAHWPRRGVRGQVHFRLSREKREASAVLLRIDGRAFQLAGRGWDAWAPDPRADAEIVLAMRSGLAMSIETRSAGGQLVRDQYRLRGAATAVDAAALGCLGR
jgi:hypothetical protein